MNKLVAIFCFFLYSFTTVGATINAHYCMGEYAGSSLFHTTTDECGKCGMKAAKSKGCCSDKSKVVQLKVEHNQLQGSLAISKFFFEAITSFYYCSNTQMSFSGTNDIFHFIYPPPLHKQRLHLLNCVFLV